MLTQHGGACLLLCSGQDDMEIDEPEPALTQPLQAAPPSAPSAAPSSAPSLAPSHLLQQQGPAQPVEAPAALTDAYKAVDFLTERVLGPTAAGGNWPVSSMDMRPALEKAHEELTGALNALVRDGTSCSMLVMGERGVGKTLVGCQGTLNSVQQEGACAWRVTLS